MAVKSYVDEFSKNYERPQVDGFIVGFSGIDPQRKSSASGSSCDCDSSSLSDEQKAIIKEIIQNELELIDFDSCECDPSKLSDEQKILIRKIIDDRLEELIINYDGGEIDPVNPEPQPQPQPQPQPLPVDAGDINHELLDGLLGGDSNGHFHLTDSQLKKLIIMIDTFFPDGSDSVIIKPVGPVNPDLPDEPIDEFDPYGGLPSGTPPAWQIHTLPSGTFCYSGVKKMFYGNFDANNASVNALLFLSTNSTAKNITARYSTDLQTWKTFSGISAAPPDHISAFFRAVIASGSVYLYHIINHGDDSKTSVLRWGRNTSYTNVISGNGFNSLCFSPLLNALLVSGSTGDTTLLVYKNGFPNVTKKTSSNCLLTVNEGCAAWHPTTAVFCLTGIEGTSTSFDGETWTLNKDAPHNLMELSYREDLDSFVAWSGDDKTFYASPDGINWNQLCDTPIPLDNISTVHYEPTRQWYCAVGLGDGNAYFSKDLKHWIPTKLRNNSPVDVGDVIYMSSTGLYVAMPTSGNYFYTFNPSEWTD